MQVVMRKLVQGVDRINWLCGWFLAALLLVMTVLISWQVFARYVMGHSLTFSEEVARFSMVWMTMLGAAYAYRHGSLIAVELLSGFANGRFARELRLLVALVSCVFAWVLLTEGLHITERVVGQTSPSLRVSMGWLYAAVPAGAAMIFINAFAIIADTFTAKKD
ncbi:TRAP transporter small permease [Pseudomonas segetis]|uniref:TRAP transporter small permease protein n=1 Tax=Pseudomonas segetis TaxID=298908 RepID=A0A239ALV4_9PSED|nr:TRAP transporter small permease [Pseudomonas segetis]SNR96637.1 TRAP-type C4-dicarboxylate transport system, small permease component [Pseudomonas segetis]